MHSNIYIFTCISGTITSYPHDYTHEIFKYAIGKSKNSAQIVLVRRDNLLHYCYVRSIREKQYFGICFRTDNIYNRIADLFGEFDHIYTEIVSAGILLQMDTNGQVIIGTTDFAKASVEITERSDRFINLLRLSAQTTQPLPPADFSISIKDCIELSLEQSTNAEITDAIKKYNNVYLVKSQAEIARLTEITNIIKKKNEKIKQLQDTIVQQDTTISDLKKQKNKFKWVLILLSVIFIGSIVFLVHNNEQNIIIYDLTQELADARDSLKSTSAKLTDTTNALISIKKTLSAAEKTITNLEETNSSVTDSLRQTERELAHKEALIKEKDKSIADLRAQVPKSYKTKYKEQYLYNKCGSEYTKSTCYFINKGAIITIYSQKNGYGLTHEGGWIPMNCLEKY